MPLDKNSHQTVAHFGCISFSMYACPKCYNFVCLHTSQDQNELHLKKWFFFLPKSASFVSRSHSYLAKRKRIALDGQLTSTPEPIEFCMASYQGLYAKFVSVMSPKCSIVESDSELMLMALHTHFLPQQQYSRVNVQFLAFHALVYRWGCHFISLYSQDNEYTELTVLLFFQNPYTIFAHILQYSQRCSSAYTTTFGGRIKQIICQIRHELSVSIHEISTS